MTHPRSLRILHTEASLGWGGQEIRILAEAQEFAKRGHVVHLAADPTSDIVRAAERAGIGVTQIPLQRKSLAGLRAMRGLMRSFEPDVVNPHSSTDHWAVALGRIGLARRPRVVRTRHISAPVKRNRATRWLYNRGTDFVMTTGQSIVDALTVDGFLPRERVASVPTGIDTDRYRAGERTAARRAVGLPIESYLFGIVATLRSWKGHEHLLEAFARLDERAAHLVIVGDGPQDENIRARIARLAIADRVTLAGRQDDVVPYLQALDAFVLPSYANEGIPQAVLQALACEVPIISCPVGGIPECTAGLGSVRLVAPKDPMALAVAMGALMEHPVGKALLDEGRRRVLARHSLSRMYEDVLRCFTA